MYDVITFVCSYSDIVAEFNFINFTFFLFSDIHVSDYCDLVWNIGAQCVIGRLFNCYFYCIFVLVVWIHIHIDCVYEYVVSYWIYAISHFYQFGISITVATRINFTKWILSTVCKLDVLI